MNNEKKAMDEAIRAVQREMAREWRRRNPDKAKLIQRRYWEKKAAKLLAEKKNALGGKTSEEA